VNAPDRHLTGIPAPAPILTQPHRRQLVGELTWGGGAVALTLATATIPLLRDPGFYFTDDYQSYFLPGFLEIARLIKGGEWPFLSPRLLQGGAFLAEYQYALFNPVCILLYLVLDSFERLDRAAAFYALSHLGILAGGLYALARVVGADRPASVLGALSGATSLWLIYWGAANWIPALVSAAWLAWAAAALFLAYRHVAWVPAASGAVFLMIASGWPFADLALAAGGSFALTVALWRTRNVHSAARAGLALVLGGMLAAPSLLPLAAAIPYSAREATQMFSHMLSTPLPAVLAVGLPLFPQSWLGFEGFALRAFPPMQYVSWWVPLAFVHLTRGRLHGRAAVVAAALVLFALLASAPGVWQFRWSFRFLPYLHLACAVVGAWALSQPAHCWAPRRVLLVVLGGALVAFLQAPELAGAQGTVTLEVLLAAGLACRWLPRERRAALALMGASHIGLFATLTGLAPTNDFVKEWRPPVDRAAYSAPTLGSGDVTLNLFEQELYNSPRASDLPPQVYTELPHGNTALLTGTSAMAGYSPMKPAGFGALCFTNIGATCVEGVARLLRPDPASGASALDLARITRVAAQPRAYAETFEAAAGPGWRRREGKAAVFFDRDPPVAFPGTISAAPTGVRFGGAQEGAQTGHYALSTGSGGHLVWARAWYPGYEASWKGAPLVIRVVNGLFPGVTLPMGEAGELTLRYVPRGLVPGLAVAGAAVLLLVMLGTSMLVGRRGRMAAGI
jgi:hypothetical protein